MGISEKVINMIIENNISVSEISRNTGIEEDRLMDTETVFTAEELLELCSYLNLQPNRII